jgi:hypothetical protein
MPPSLDDLSTVPHEDVLDIAEQRLGRVLNRRDTHYSKRNGTAGFPTSDGTWVRLSWRRPDRFSTHAWTGIEATSAIVGVPRPEWCAAASWSDTEREVVWRADEMTRAADPALSTVADVAADPELPQQWWSSLRAALAALAAHPTDRVCMGQQHLSKRIAEVYGDEVDTTVTQWCTAHGDLGWANLCGPTLTLLDWESWGTGPLGWDAACLWAASLHIPALAERVLAEFDDVLDTRDGQLSRLLLCANTARTYKRTEQKAPLTDAMAESAEALLAQLRAE